MTFYLQKYVYLYYTVCQLAAAVSTLQMCFGLGRVRLGFGLTSVLSCA